MLYAVIMGLLNMYHHSFWVEYLDKQDSHILYQQAFPHTWDNFYHYIGLSQVLHSCICSLMPLFLPDLPVHKCLLD